MKLFSKKSKDRIERKDRVEREERENSRHSQVTKLFSMGQSFWYMLTIVIFLGCTLLGFGIAFLITKLLIDLQIK